MSEPGTKPGYWAVLPAQVRYDPHLPASAKILYAEISSLSDQTGYCYASNEYFQELYSISERTVQGQLKALKDGGYIRIINGDGGSGRRRIYAGINPLFANPAEICGVTPQISAPNPAEICGENKKDNNKLNDPPYSPPEGTESEPRKRRRREPKKAPDWKPDRFAAFWSAYPRGESKQAAIAAWDSLKPDDELLDVMAHALKRQMMRKDWQRGVGIPYASTWLNQRRWEDESKPLATAPQPDRAEQNGGYELWT